MSPLTLLVWIVTLTGCGGGVGKTTNPPNPNGVAVHTDWTGSSAVSETISIRRTDGTVSSQTTTLKSFAVTTSSLVAPAGPYTIQVESNSATGVTGTLSVTTVSGSTSINIDAGIAPSTLRITPDTVDLTYGQKFRLGVAGAAADGNFAFLAPGSVSFSASGATAVVDTTGVVTASTIAGTSSIQAKSGTLAATANVNVSVASITRSKWTVMVYLNASNDLYPYALPNIQQMSQVAYNSDVRFIVQWKESTGTAVSGYPQDFSGTRRYLVSNGAVSGSSIPAKLIQDLGTGIDMGNVQTLHDFVTWTKANYPADRYVCVVWNHGNGWQSAIKPRILPVTRGVSYDNELGTYIDTWDLPKAFWSQPVDVLSFDACLMQMMEVDDDLKSSCSFIASSEENTPGPGYPYQRVFKAFADQPSSDTVSLLHSFVTGHTGNPSYQNQPVTQSVIDPTRLVPIETAIDALASQLIANKSTISGEIMAIRSAMQKYADPGDGRYYYDLVDLSQRLANDAALPSSVQFAASALSTVVGSSVVWEGHSSLDQNSHGLAIDFSPSTNANLAYYGKTNLAKATRWLQWLQVAP